MFNTLDDIRSANSNFFSADTLRFFNSRVSSIVHPDNNGGAYFVTSEKFDTGYVRLYTLRYCTPIGRIETIGQFQEFFSARSAHKRAEEFVAGTRNRPCFICGLPIAPKGTNGHHMCSDPGHADA